MRAKRAAPPTAAPAARPAWSLDLGCDAGIEADDDIGVNVAGCGDLGPSVEYSRATNATVLIRDFVRKEAGNVERLAAS